MSFVTGSLIGELIVWDILDWTVQACERNFWDPSPQLDTQQEIKLCQKTNDISIHHFTWDEEVRKNRVYKLLYFYFHKEEFGHTGRALGWEEGSLPVLLMDNMWCVGIVSGGHMQG